MRSVAVECVEPIEHDVAEAVRDELDPPEDEGAASGSRRARRRSAPATSSCSRISSMTRARVLARARTSERRPESMLTSPVNSPGR